MKPDHSHSKKFLGSAHLRALAAFVILILIANLILFALRKISRALFWIVIAIAAVFAYFVLPKIKNRKSEKNF